MLLKPGFSTLIFIIINLMRYMVHIAQLLCFVFHGTKSKTDEDFSKVYYPLVAAGDVVYPIIAIFIVAIPNSFYGWLFYMIMAYKFLAHFGVKGEKKKYLYNFVVDWLSVALFISYIASFK